MARARASASTLLLLLLLLLPVLRVLLLLLTLPLSQVCLRFRSSRGFYRFSMFSAIFSIQLFILKLWPVLQLPLLSVAFPLLVLFRLFYAVVLAISLVFVIAFFLAAMILFTIAGCWLRLTVVALILGCDASRSAACIPV